MIETQSVMSCKRNFACPLYDSCLSQAVDRKLNGFQCLGCPSEGVVRPDWHEVQERDSHRVMSLFAAVCRNRVRPSSQPLTREELAFLWSEGEDPVQDEAAEELD